MKEELDFEVMKVKAEHSLLYRPADIEKNISFHTSRHTFAVMTLAAGGDIYTLRTLMGHSIIKTTQIYADIVMEKKVDAISKISEYFSKNPIKSVV